MFLSTLVRYVARLLVTILVAGLLGAMLVRIAPAFGVSELELDPHLSREFKEQRPEQSNVLVFYFQYLRRAVAGDFGISSSLQRPIGELLRERLPVSLRSLGIGASAGVLTGIALAIVVVWLRSPVVTAAPVVASTVLLSIPSAALALLFLVAGWPPSLSLAAVVFPRVYRYAVAVLARCAEAPHVLAAKARGISPGRILTAHVVPLAAPQLLAVAGMAVSIGFPALVPIEAVCDSPGVMQLALKAALARDLPLLVTLTMIAAIVILLGNAAADLSAEAMERKA